MRRAIALGLTLATLIPLSTPAGWADPPRPTLSGDIRITVDPTLIDTPVVLPGSNKIVNMTLRGISVQDALRALARKGGFNVVADESVQGTLSLDLNNITVQDALDTIKGYAKLSYSIKNGTLMVASADSPQGKAMARSAARIVPLKYANAKVVADLLNKTIFSPPGGSAATGGNANPAEKKVTADFQTNSLLILASPDEMKLAQEHIAALDRPRLTKTWRLSHANALHVASLLATGLFSDGLMPPMTMMSSGAGAGGGAGGSGNQGLDQTSPGAMPTSLRVRNEKIQDGTGANTPGSGQSGGGGGGGAAGGMTTNTTINSQMTLRGRVKNDEIVTVNPLGALIVPDTRMNTVTLVGTAEQIAMAERMIPTLDRRVPQVVLEASLIEVSNTLQKDAGVNIGNNKGLFGFGFNNAQSNVLNVTGNTQFSQNVGMKTAPWESLLQITSRPITKSSQLAVQLNALLSDRKAKVLAHPTVVATHDSEAIISIVDEIIKASVLVQSGGIGTAIPPQRQIQIGEAGIVLNLLPRIGANGNISLRVRPTVSNVRETITDPRLGDVTLISKRELLAQEVVLKDGESFVLGGLISDSDVNNVRKVPGLSNLPIVGALGRASSRAKNKTELIVVVTPHIVNDDPIDVATSTQPVAENGTIPVSFNQPGTNPPGASQPSAQPIIRTASPATPQTLPVLLAPTELNPDSLETGSRQISRVLTASPSTSPKAMPTAEAGINAAAVADSAPLRKPAVAQPPAPRIVAPSSPAVSRPPEVRNGDAAQHLSNEALLQLLNQFK